MPAPKTGRPRKPARLYLRPAAADRAATWVIRDGARVVGTGCGPERRGEAEQALAAYLSARWTPPATRGHGLADLLIADIMAAYLTEHASHTTSAAWIGHTSMPVIKWWGDKTLGEVKGATCRDYVTWRTAQMVVNTTRARKDGTRPTPRAVSTATARHELKTLRAAINHWHAEHGPLPSLPVVTLPERAPARDVWLTRSEAARLIRLARRDPLRRHLARLILIGVYTGTRPGAILRLGWLPSPTGGWADLDAGVLHRRGRGANETKKRQPPAKLPPSLLGHMRRWAARDQQRKPVVQQDGTRRHCVRIVHYLGRPVGKLRRSWAGLCRDAGIGRHVTPHVLRHTAATWLMQSGVDTFVAAGFLGLSEATLREVYSHHHPEFQSAAAAASRGRPAVAVQTKNTVQKRHGKQSQAVALRGASRHATR